MEKSIHSYRPYKTSIIGQQFLTVLNSLNSQPTTNTVQPLQEKHMHHNISRYQQGTGITIHKNQAGDEYTITARYFNKDMQIQYIDGTEQRISKKEHRYGNFTKETSHQ